MFTCEEFQFLKKMITAFQCDECKHDYKTCDGNFNSKSPCRMLIDKIFEMTEECQE